MGQFTGFTRREALGAIAGAALGAAAPWAWGDPAPPARPRAEPFGPVPTPQQLAWQDAELTMFFHFGMNTFTNREWGEGTEDPKRFNPAALEPRQWVYVAREAGFRYAILTAKHHDGFCLWPSKYTEHSVKNSPWKGGKGDVVREFARACGEAHLKLGLYVSPWDRHEPSYGTSTYNQHFLNQLTELLTGYGEVGEVWFDGANGEGPNGKKQEYDWEAIHNTVRKHQPKALISICGPDIRWVGNEDGFAKETEWSVQPASSPLQKPVDGKVWYPSECDVSIRPGWFWHKAEDEKVKSLSHLLDIYFRSVGHNSTLLLNVPPNDRGLLAAPDVARLKEFRSALERAFSRPLTRFAEATASSARTSASPRFAIYGSPESYWSPAGDGVASWLEVSFSGPRTFNLVAVQENVALGQRVKAYKVEANTEDGWKEICRGTTIGHKKLDRVADVTASQVRLTILETLAPPQIRAFSVFHAEELPPEGAKA